MLAKSSELAGAVASSGTGWISPGLIGAIIVLAGCGYARRRSKYRRVAMPDHDADRWRAPP